MNCFLDAHPGGVIFVYITIDKSHLRVAAPDVGSTTLKTPIVIAFCLFFHGGAGN